jgi:hypothetical protein
MDRKRSLEQRGSAPLDKKKFSQKLAEEWPFTAAAIQMLLEWMDQGGADWQQPYYVLKLASDAELDLSEVGRILLPTK